MPDSLAPEEVEPLLRGRFGRPYVYRRRCASTQHLLDGAMPEGAVAVADEQSEGRGRLGRRWLAPPGTGILCSVLLRPVVASERLSELTIVAAEACAAAISAAARIEAGVKHPNDVLIGARKIAGVLGEAREGHVVLGIGINANMAPDQLPTGLDTPATSILVERGSPVRRAEVLAVLLERLEARYDAWR